MTREMSQPSATRTPAPAATVTIPVPTLWLPPTRASATLAPGSSATAGSKTARSSLSVHTLTPSTNPIPLPVVTVADSTDGALAVTVVAVGIFSGFSLLLQGSGLRALQRAQRRERDLELGQLRSQALAQRNAEVRQILAQQSEGWRQILSQLVADALGGSGLVGKEGVLELSSDPAPRLTVTGNDREYIFTTRPELLGQKQTKGRTEQIISLDGRLDPTAAVEVQAVWEHLASRRLREQRLVLPRRSTWFLVVREGKKDC